MRKKHGEVKKLTQKLEDETTKKELIIKNYSEYIDELKKNHEH